MERITIQGFIAEVSKSLKNWVDNHYDYEMWRGMITSEYDTLTEAFEDINSNHKGMIQIAGMSYDWAEQVAAELQNDNLFEKCPVCSEIIERGYECSQGHEEEFVLATQQEVYQSIRELGCGNEWYLDRALQKLHETIIQDLEQGYGIGGIKDDCLEAVKKIEEADTPEDQIAAALAGAHIAHVSGRVVEDYSMWGEEIATICDICANGLSAYFQPEEIKEFIQGGVTV